MDDIIQGNTAYKSDDGVLFSADGKALVAFPGGSSGNYGYYEIPDGVTSIEAAFCGCGALTDVIIPEGVTSIGYGTFRGCGDLIYVEIPSSVTSIGNYAFYDCSSLTDATIPAGVTSIGESAFSKCTSLKDVFYAGSKAQWAEIRIDNGNEPLTCAMIHYASGTVVITFDANGGTGTMTEQNVPVGTATALAENAFKRDGYAFTGWNTKADGSGTAYADKATVTLNNDLTLYAQWEKNATAAPELVSATEVSGGIEFKWKAASGAAKYRVYRKTGSESWKKLAETTGTSYTDKSVTAGTTYTYTVRAIDADGNLSAYDKTGLTLKYKGSSLTQPKLASVTMTKTGVQFKWKATDGAAKYLVYRKTGSGSWKYIGATSKTSYTDKKVTAGKTYTYSVRAKNAAGKKSAYDKTGLKITYIAPPELVGVKQVRSGVKFTWKSAAGAEKYRVYRKTGSGKWTYLAQTGKTSYIDKKAVSGKTYTYMVRAKDAYGHLSKYDTKGLSIKVK